MSQNTMGKASKQHNFASLPGQQIPRSSFPLQFRRLHTMNAAELNPVVWLEALPGDEFRFDVGVLCRLLSPLSTPMMDRLIFDWQVWFSPDRLLWNHWEQFQGQVDDPGDSTDYVIPWLKGSIEGDAYEVEVGGVADALGFPLGILDPGQDVFVTALLHRMYRRTWNEWYRDQTYQDRVSVSLGDGPDEFTDVDTLLRRGKRHDYFSSALDAPQMGPGIPIPFSEQAPIYGDGDPIRFQNNFSGVFGEMDLIPGPPDHVGWTQGGSGGDQFGLGQKGDEGGFYNSHIYADVAQAAPDLNAFRQAVVLQQIAELDKRGGTRYVETLLSRWNVDAEDYRLQRVEFVGAGSAQIGSTNVAQSAPGGSGTSKLGHLAAYAHGTGVSSVRYRTREHGYLMIMCSVRAPLTYQQQLHRGLTRRVRHDFAEPLAMHLGEQPVFRYEMYYPPAGATSEYMEQVWGWQERFAEYRYTPSLVSGLFRSEAAQSLDTWHLGLDYGATPPVHDAQWIEDDPPISRVIAQTDQPQFLLDLAIDGTKISSMPVYSVPGLRRI